MDVSIETSMSSVIQVRMDQGLVVKIRHTARWNSIFFSYLLTWEVDLIEILEIMAQMWQYVIFFKLKSTKVTSDFILN